MIGQALESAREGEASTAQIALLEDAERVGEVTLEHAHEAALNAVQCMTEAGVSASYVLYTVQGLDIPGYEAHVGLEDNSKLEALADRCDTKEFQWISQVYQTQPAATEAHAQHFVESVPLIRACLESHGVRVDADATADEIEQAMTQALTDSAGDVNCFTVLDGGDPAKG
ncbi:hypothetical protein [Demequina sp.]|uniref:hypothetical protein n=1 Tax=Demequina sp. TaxID=2050685 RepID=UPI003D0FB9AE